MNKTVQIRAIVIVAFSLELTDLSMKDGASWSASVWPQGSQTPASLKKSRLGIDQA
jgi:hypothetical protein